MLFEVATPDEIGARGAAESRYWSTVQAAGLVPEARAADDRTMERVDEEISVLFIQILFQTPLRVLTKSCIDAISRMQCHESQYASNRATVEEALRVHLTLEALSTVAAAPPVNTAASSSTSSSIAVIAPSGGDSPDGGTQPTTSTPPGDETVVPAAGMSPVSPHEALAAAFDESLGDVSTSTFGPLSPEEVLSHLETTHSDSDAIARGLEDMGPASLPLPRTRSRQRAASSASTPATPTKSPVGEATRIPLQRCRRTHHHVVDFNELPVDIRRATIRILVDRWPAFRQSWRASTPQEPMLMGHPTPQADDKLLWLVVDGPSGASAAVPLRATPARRSLCLHVPSWMGEGHFHLQVHIGPVASVHLPTLEAPPRAASRARRPESATTGETTPRSFHTPLTALRAPPQSTRLSEEVVSTARRRLALTAPEAVAISSADEELHTAEKIADLDRVLSASDAEFASEESGRVDMVVTDCETEHSSIFAFSSLNSSQAAQVLCDSGAQQSVVPLSCLTLHGLRPTPLQHGEPHHIMGVRGMKIPVLGTCMLDVHGLQSKLLVLNTKSPEFPLIGAPLLRQLRAVLDYVNGLIELRAVGKTIRLNRKPSKPWMLNVQVPEVTCLEAALKREFPDVFNE